MPTRSTMICCERWKYEKDRWPTTDSELRDTTAIDIGYWRGKSQINENDEIAEEMDLHQGLKGEQGKDNSVKINRYSRTNFCAYQILKTGTNHAGWIITGNASNRVSSKRQQKNHGCMLHIFHVKHMWWCFSISSSIRYCCCGNSDATTRLGLRETSERYETGFGDFHFATIRTNTKENVVHNTYT